MDSLKKVISLNQASKISGYNQDYLGSLIRKGEIRGQKMGRVWFTTEEEIKTFLMKQKIRNKEAALKEFFSTRRVKRIFFVTTVLLLCAVLTLVYSNDKKNTFAGPAKVDSSLNQEVEAEAAVVNQYGDHE
jgi:hypothetical protein